MANEGQLKILKQGVETWNKWRKEHPQEKIDLTEMDLIGGDLREVDLINADLRRAHLIGADLRRAHLNGADLRKADLREVDLSGADLNTMVTRMGDFLIFDNTPASIHIANLNVANLSGANLSGANLRGVDLRGVDLIQVDLSRADLRGINLSKVDLSRVNLSGAIVDAYTLKRTKKLKKGVQIGVNGIWVKLTDSAALMALTPPGNSMQGSNPDAVIESLKRSRRLHVFSMGFVAIVILIAVLELKNITIKSYGIDIPANRFGLLAMAMSICLLCLASSFMADALKGARYLSDRNSAMTVGNFPWVLSRYTGKGLMNRIESLIPRLIMSFHPLFYVYYLNQWLKNWEVTNLILFDIFIVILLIFCGRIFHISQSFQKPILFDRKTEEERPDNLKLMTKLSESVEKQTEAVNDLIDILKLKQDKELPVETDEHKKLSN